MEAMTATPTSVLDTRCPLCGELLFTVAASGRVRATTLHAVALSTQRLSWQAYLLCDECGRLAGLPRGMPLN